MVAIEAKAARRYRREYRAGIDSLRSGTSAAASYIVYRGDKELDVGGTRVLPLEVFLRRLHAGEIIG
jgi:hypothetical protein